MQTACLNGRAGCGIWNDTLFILESQATSLLGAMWIVKVAIILR
jgi:hypothetical protein